MSEEALKPCPFCGGKIEIEEIIKDDAWSFICTGDCKISGCFESSREAAIKAVNRRAESSTVTALRAQVVDLEESVIELRKSLIDTLECWTLEEEIFRNEKAVRARAVLVATALAATEGEG